nr:hypothetical protein [uncultured organism]
MTETLIGRTSLGDARNGSSSLHIFGGAFSLYQSQVSDVLSGIIYAPGTNISIYGSQTVTIPKDGCLELIGRVVDIHQTASLKMAPCGARGMTARNVSLTR